MHDDDMPDHPAVVDGNDTAWTWRGKGYAVASIKAARDFQGNPWLTTPETIRELFGKPHVPVAVAADAAPKGGRLSPG